PGSTRPGGSQAVASGLRHRVGFRLVAGYLSVLLLLGVAWAVAALGANALRVRFSHTVQIDDALAANVVLRTKLADDEETGVRGYLLTHRPVFLEPYTRAHRALPALRAHGDALGAGEPAVRPVLATMWRRAVTWERWARQIL